MKINKLAAGLILLFIQPIGAFASDSCEACGCHCKPKKVCRVVEEVKKIPKTVYACECEDFCVPGPSQLVGSHCESREDPSRPGCNLASIIRDWLPGCAEVYTKSKLVKKSVEHEETTYKWVVEELCPSCALIRKNGDAEKNKQPDSEKKSSPQPKETPLPTPKTGAVAPQTTINMLPMFNDLRLNWGESTLQRLVTFHVVQGSREAIPIRSRFNFFGFEFPSPARKREMRSSTLQGPSVSMICLKVLLII